MPNKIYNIMASGWPVIVIAPRESDLAQLVQLAECGICVLLITLISYAETILSLKNNQTLLGELGKNGHYYLEMHYTQQRCMDEYEALLKRVARC